MRQWQRAEFVTTLFSAALLFGLAVTLSISSIVQLPWLQFMSNPMIVFILGVIDTTFSCAELLVRFNPNLTNRRIVSAGKNYFKSPWRSPACVDIETCLDTDQNGGVTGILQENAGTDSKHNVGSEASDRDFVVPKKSPIATTGPPSQSIIVNGSIHSRSSRGRKHPSFGRKRPPLQGSLNVHPFHQETTAATRADEEPDSNIEEERVPLLPDHSQDSQHASHNDSQPTSSVHEKPEISVRTISMWADSDLLANLAVTLASLAIWKHPHSKVEYLDPALSLVISLAILSRTFPIIGESARALLQAVPPGLNVDDVREDIEQLPGILSAHHIHIWQLSESKLIASLHIQVDGELYRDGGTDYMHLAQQIRNCLRNYGIHSSTTQPEFHSSNKI